MKKGSVKKTTPAPVPVTENSSKKVNEVKKNTVKSKKEETVVVPVPILNEKESVVEKDESSTEGQVEEKALGDTLINEITDKIGSVQLDIKTIQQTLKLLIKEYEKQKKIIAKMQKKRDNAKKSPSGFAKPCKISEELCGFIGVPSGSERSRTDVTRFINAYVKEKELNNPQNRREFFPDEKLRAILNVQDGDKVTYFILQRLIAHHFPLSINKQNALAAQAAAAAAQST